GSTCSLPVAVQIPVRSPTVALTRLAQVLETTVSEGVRMPQSRRNFLQGSLCAAGAVAASSLLNDLSNVAAAAPTSWTQADDYKALVCVFLFGGNDGDNTLIPYSTTDYNAYATARSTLAIPRVQLLPIAPTHTDGRDWSLHPSLPELQSLFGLKNLAIVANTGGLLAPTTRH